MMIPIWAGIIIVPTVIFTLVWIIVTLILWLIDGQLCEPKKSLFEVLKDELEWLKSLKIY